VVFVRYPISKFSIKLKITAITSTRSPPRCTSSAFRLSASCQFFQMRHCS
jgi:hypothetical protein